MPLHCVCFQTYNPAISMLLIIFHSICCWSCWSLILAWLISAAPSVYCLLREACHGGRDMVLLGKELLKWPKLIKAARKLPTQCPPNFSWMEALSRPGVISYSPLACGNSIVTPALLLASPANCIIKSRTHQQDGRRSALLSCIVFHLLCKTEITVFTVLKLWQTVFGHIWCTAKFCFIKCHGLILLHKMVSHFNLCPPNKYHRPNIMELLQYFKSSC